MFLSVLFCNALKIGRKIKIFIHGKIRVHRRLLRQIADFAFCLQRLLQNITAVNGDRAAGR